MGWFFRYKVAGPSEYLAITGYRVEDIKLVKKAMVLPGQKCEKVDVSPVNYTFEVQAMSAEKLPFILPAVFTIGPRVQDKDSLLLYARLISPHDKLSNHVNELVQGIIEGETRVLAACTMPVHPRQRCVKITVTSGFNPSSVTLQYLLHHNMDNWGNCHKTSASLILL